MTKTDYYGELMAIPCFIDRFRYLKELSHHRSVGDVTFGEFRYLNQSFYHSNEWKRVRNQVIARDNGCDLAVSDRPIPGQLIVHHICPISIESPRELWMSLSNLICCSYNTHEAIHFGSEKMLYNELFERKPNDQCPWK